MTYSITWTQTGAEVNFTGILRPEELATSIQELIEDARFETCKYQIINLTQSELTGLSLNHVLEQAEMDSRISSDSPKQIIAIVTDDSLADSLVFHYKLVAETYRIQWDLKRFSSLEQARDFCKKR